MKKILNTEILKGYFWNIYLSLLKFYPKYVKTHEDTKLIMTHCHFTKMPNSKTN